MKKAFDQTVRDIKREVNKTVLKIPKIEQKVLDGTSNEPWGPHGSLLADIAQATRNHHEYQMIMAVLWKRINDTGKNWRHVYKGLTVLEYLVAHGSERVIDDIKEHAYQISTLSNFQYIDSSGRDQGNNVRKKSQNLVSLVNDKERIIEVRQKAASNRDKFRNTSSMGGMYRPNSYSSMGGYDDRSEGRYGSRDMDRNVDFYGREKEYGNRDDDRYGRSGEGRDVDRYDRDHGEHYSRDSYRDDDYRGRSRSVDDYQYGSRSRSSDRNGQHTFDDDGQFPSRNSGARPDEQSQDGSITRRLERKFSEQNISAPPSYEEAVGESGNTVQSQRDVETSAPTPTRSFPPPVSSTPRQPTHGTTGSPPNQKVYGFDEFDPRGSASAAPTASNSAQTNVQDSLAIVPVALATSTTDSELHIQLNSGAIPTFGTSEAAASYTPTQTFDDPFGDSPFKAISSSNVKGQPHASQTDPSQSTINHSPVMPSAGFETSAIVPSFHHGESFSTANYSTSGIPVHSQTNSYHSNEESLEHQNINVLADLLPPPGSLSPVVPQPPFTTLNGPSAQPNFPALPGFPAQQNINNFGNFQQDIGNMGPTDFQNPTGPGIPFSILQEGPSAHVNSYMAPPNAGLPTQPINAGSSQDGYVAPHSSRVTHQTVTGPPGQLASGNFNQPQSSAVLKASQAPYQSPDFPTVKSNHDVGSFLPEAVSNTSTASQQFQPASGSLFTVSQTSKNNFETKSTVWADTLSRGLVNLNISGPKTNPLADIGVDFDSLNRKEKRMEKPSTAPVVSTVNMGKAMGSGTGMGRAGASALRPPPGGMLGSGMGMGANPSVGMGMRGYGGMNQPMGGMGMNMGMGQRFQMQPPGTNLPGVYNPMMGAGSYAPQRPPYGGYR